MCCAFVQCSCLVYRYFREKVLPSSRMSDGSPVDKGEIINQFKRVRDSPTEEVYEANKEKLFEMTEDLEVKC